MKKLQTLLSWTWTPFFALLTGAMAVVLLTWALVPAEPTRLFGEPKEKSESSSLIKSSRTSSLGASDRLGVSSPRKSSSKTRNGSGTSHPRNPIAGIKRAADSAEDTPPKPRRAKRPARVKRSRAVRRPAPPPPKPASDEEEEEEEEEEEADEEEQEEEEEAEEQEEKAEDPEGPPEPKPGAKPEPNAKRRQLVAPKLLKRLPFIQGNRDK